jgi:hypothetical protein
MAEVRYYWSSPIFTLYYVDDSGSSSIVFIDMFVMVYKNTLAGSGLLQAAAFMSSSTLEFLFLSMYSTVKPLNFFPFF